MESVGLKSLPRPRIHERVVLWFQEVMKNLEKKRSRSLANTSSSIKQSMKNIDLNSVKDTVIMTPNKIRRSMSGMTGTQALVKAPVLTVVLCLVVTGFFTLHSGAIDCREQVSKFNL